MRAQTMLGFPGAPPEPLENFPDPKKPWRGICSPGCWRAKSDPSTCKCKCGGKYHGRGRRKARDPLEILEETGIIKLKGEASE